MGGVKESVKEKSIFILNIKDHIRDGERQFVTEYHYNSLTKIGFELKDEIRVLVSGNGFGSNGKIRIGHESLLKFELRK
jgi:hypothetical protein